jgi:hypothetical protein
MIELKAFLAYLVLIALCVAVAACNAPAPPASLADRGDVHVTVRWVEARAIDAACKQAGAKDGEHFNACAASGPRECTILAVQPRNFEDADALKVLGHETWHCFGARHN